MSTQPGDAAQIDVQSHATRPKLALLRREGDPQAAVAIAIAGGQEPSRHAALAGMLAHRFREAEVATEVHHDGLGVRVVARLEVGTAAEDATALLAAVLSATQSPARPADLKPANARVEALRDDALASRWLAPVATCVGDPRALAERLTPLTVPELEKLRAEALVMERIAIAAVGPDIAVDAVAEAHKKTQRWPRGAVSTPAREPSSHGAFFSPDVSPGTAQLHMAFLVPDAVAAVGAADRLRAGPPLSSKLDGLSAPWRLRTLRAVARPRGGCLSVVAEPHDLGDVAHVDDVGASAARALAATRREVALQLAVETDPFVVTREIIGAGDPAVAARRAAWWALTSAADANVTAYSALEIAAPRGEPYTSADGTPIEESSVHASYLRQAPKSAAEPALEAIADRRVAVEKGRGQVWMLLASPCPVLQEGPWDAGLAALSATVVAAEAGVADGVTVEPWVSASGVGVIAHAPVAGAEEPKAAWLRRVARGAGRAYGTVPQSATVFRRAHAAALGHSGNEAGVLFFRLAARTFTDHPSWVAPWGSAEGLAPLSVFDVADHWRGVLRQPARVAMIHAGTEDEAAAALDEVDHRLLADARHRPCSEVAKLSPPVGSEVEVPASTPTVMFSLPYVSHEERAAAELSRAILTDGKGAMDHGGVTWDVRLVGSPRAGALVLTAHPDVDGVKSARDAMRDRLAAWGKDAVASDVVARARESVERSRRAASNDPRERLVRLWLGPRPDVDDTGWQAWLKKRGSQQERVVITTTQS